MIYFGWDLCNTCNYRCPYCGVWENAGTQNKPLTPEQWDKIWTRIYDIYGKCHIYISGGEPSTYPGFFDLVRKLSVKHFPEICTNLSWDISLLVPELSTQQLKIAPTFHPSFSDFDVFFKKIIKIKDYLPDRQVYYVAYPNHIKDMPLRSKLLKAEGVKLIPLPLRGDGFVLNSEEEKKIIEDLSPYKGSRKMDYQLNKITPKGKLCRAGKDYAVIRVSGLVDRCSQHCGGSVGNFLDADFKLNEGPAVCDKEYCPIESQWII